MKNSIFFWKNQKTLESYCPHVTEGQTKIKGYSDLVTWQLRFLSIVLTSAINLVTHSERVGLSWERFCLKVLATQKEEVHGDREVGRNPVPGSSNEESGKPEEPHPGVFRPH